MTLDEAMEATVSAAEARAEIELHDCEGWDAFVAEAGEHPEYTGAQVLLWLGY